MNLQASKEALQQRKQSTTRIQVMEDGTFIVYVLTTKTYHCHANELTGEMMNVKAEGVYEAVIVNIPVENMTPVNVRTASRQLTKWNHFDH